MSNLAAAGGKGQIKKLKLISNYSGDLNLTDGFLGMMLYESILDYSTRATLSFVDTGYRSNKSGTGAMEKDDINLVEGEKFEFKVIDGYGQVLECKNNYQLITDNIDSVDEKVNKTIINLSFTSQEHLTNDFVKNRLTKRYEGKISDSVFRILKEFTTKPVDIDQTLNEFVFIGNNDKPFYKIPWLAKKSVPDIPNAKADLAGYFFYETFYDGVFGGYKFKSIDKLWTNPAKRKLIYNDKVTTPPGYTGKILSYSFNSSLSISKMAKAGVFSTQQLKTFDFITNARIVNDKSDTERLKTNYTGGLEPPKIASHLDFWNTQTRISESIVDRGVLPPGTNLKDQLKFLNQLNFNEDEILRQSCARYNNLFTIRLSVMIAGDFGIHAGDIIECDFPEISSKANKIVSNKKSGLYMVIDVAHRIHANGYYTTLNLSRESIYKK
jgi:hypothetical protein